LNRSVTMTGRKRYLLTAAYWLPMLLAVLSAGPLLAQAEQQRTTGPGRDVPAGMAPPFVGQMAGNPSPDPETSLQTGIQLTQHGRFSDAIPYLLAARGHVSLAEEFAADFDLAICYVGANQFEKAIPILTELQKRVPKAANVDDLLAQAYIGIQQPDKAFDAMRKAAATDPRNEGLYVLVADACTESRAYALGLKVVDLGLRSLPNSARLHYERGVFLAQLERSDLAIQEFQLATKYGSGTEIGSMAAAQAAFLDGDMPAAIAVAREGLNKDANNYVLLAILGNALVRTGASPGQPEFAEALKAMEKAVAEQPNHSGSEVTLGKLYLMAGKTGNAIAHLEKAREIDPKNTAVYAHLAAAYRRQGNLSKAREMLAILARLNQQNAESYRNSPSGRHKSYVSSGMAQAPPDVPHL
jgi:tetratricopeptide (TPR) repeat protein